MPEPSQPPAPIDRLIRTARTWADVSVHPHPNARLTFRMGNVLIGRLRPNDMLAVPLPAPVRTVLLDHGLARPASTAPDWVTHPLRHPDDLSGATQLLRLSYLYRRLLRTRDATALHRIRTELSQRKLPEALRSVYNAMLAKRDASARPSA